MTNAAVTSQPVTHRDVLGLGADHAVGHDKWSDFAFVTAFTPQRERDGDAGVIIKGFQTEDERDAYLKSRGLEEGVNAITRARQS